MKERAYERKMREIMLYYIRREAAERGGSELRRRHFRQPPCMAIVFIITRLRHFIVFFSLLYCLLMRP